MKGLMNLKKPSKKILKCLRQIITYEAYCNCASPGNPVSFPDIENCSVRIFNFQSYGDLGMGYLIYIREIPRLRWNVFLVNKGHETISKISVKKIELVSIEIENVMSS